MRDDKKREGQLDMFGYDKRDEYRKEADEWVRKNPDAWAYIREMAVEYTYQQRKFGMKDLCEEIRWRRRAQGDGKFKLNNNYTSSLADRLKEEYPPCRPYIETRRSPLRNAG